MQDPTATYMVLRDLRAIHGRCARIMVMVSSVFLILLGGGYVIFFALGSGTVAAFVQFLLLLTGVWSALVMLKGKERKHRVNLLAVPAAA